MRVKILVALIICLFLVTSYVSAGGIKRQVSSGEEIGVPPGPMVSGSNIKRNRGKGELFFPLLDLISRIGSHYIPPGDKEPGPGWGVPEGHNIGNAPKPRITGRYLDRSGRGKFELITDFIDRIKRHEAKKGRHK